MGFGLLQKVGPKASSFLQHLATDMVPDHHSEQNNAIKQNKQKRIQVCRRIPWWECVLKLAWLLAGTALSGVTRGFSLQSWDVLGLRGRTGACNTSQGRGDHTYVIIPKNTSDQKRPQAASDRLIEPPKSENEPPNRTNRPPPESGDRSGRGPVGPPTFSPRIEPSPKATSLTTGASLAPSHECILFLHIGRPRIRPG